MHLKMAIPVDQVPQSKNPHQEHYKMEHISFPNYTGCIDPINCVYQVFQLAILKPFQIISFHHSIISSFYDHFMTMHVCSLLFCLFI